MHFCSNCSNMYYIEINSEDSNKLVYYCRKCGNKDSLLAVDNLCVSKVQIKKTEQSFNHIINKYTKLDPTLPRVSKILCPNPECKTNHGSAKASASAPTPALTPEPVPTFGTVLRNRNSSNGRKPQNGHAMPGTCGPFTASPDKGRSRVRPASGR